MAGALLYLCVGASAAGLVLGAWLWARPEWRGRSAAPVLSRPSQAEAEISPPPPVNPGVDGDPAQDAQGSVPPAQSGGPGEESTAPTLATRLEVKEPVDLIDAFGRSDVFSAEVRKESRGEQSGDLAAPVVEIEGQSAEPGTAVDAIGRPLLEDTTPRTSPTVAGSNAEVCKGGVALPGDAVSAPNQGKIWTATVADEIASTPGAISSASEAAGPLVAAAGAVSRTDSSDAPHESPQDGEHKAPEGAQQCSDAVTAAAGTAGVEEISVGLVGAGTDTGPSPHRDSHDQASGSATADEPGQARQRPDKPAQHRDRRGQRRTLSKRPAAVLPAHSQPTAALRTAAEAKLRLMLHPVRRAANLSAVLARPAGYPDLITLPLGGRTKVRAYNENHYDDVDLEWSDGLLSGEVRFDCDEGYQWLRSARRVHIFSEAPDDPGLISVGSAALMSPSAIICRQEDTGAVRSAAETCGSPELISHDRWTGIPDGWAVLSGYRPAHAASAGLEAALTALDPGIGAVISMSGGLQIRAGYLQKAVRRGSRSRPFRPTPASRSTATWLRWVRMARGARMAGTSPGTI